MEQPKFQRVGHLYLLLEDYSCTWVREGVTFKRTVKKGFLTDKASTPQFAYSLGFTPEGDYEGAALVHDRGYQAKGRFKTGEYTYYAGNGEWRDVLGPVSRSECDRLFLNMMKSFGVPMIKRQLMYRAVRAFGWISGGLGW